MIHDEYRARSAELEYRSFLDDKGIYHQKVTMMIEKEQTRLIVNINDTRKLEGFEERYLGLMKKPAEEIPLFEKALKEYVMSLSPEYGRAVNEFHIGLRGSFGTGHTSPRTLTKHLLNSTVCVHGIVSKSSTVTPKPVKLTY